MAVTLAKAQLFLRAHYTGVGWMLTLKRAHRVNGGRDLWGMCLSFKLNNVVVTGRQVCRSVVTRELALAGGRGMDRGRGRKLGGRHHIQVE